ncbi:UPF0481 protein At3g47200-like [Silene latifolia]|uniref:UPF0481 protein At3g47200-like n=1 Tax=Silene latifolia TaxID=37657 RepID=UPI003D776DCD
MSEKTRADVVISLEKRLTIVREEARNEPSATPCFIFRVPQNLRLQLSPGDDTAYIPEVVSIGPYHAGNDCLRGMDYHKTRALNSVLTRTNQPLAYYLDPMYELEQNARKCYHGEVDMTYTTFVEMMLLDGCFMLEIIRGHNTGFDQLGYSPNDPVFTIRGYNNMASLIIKDMIKLENQIPFFVLEKLFDLQESRRTSGQLAQLASAMFIKWLTGEKLEVDHLKGKFLHCLNVFQYSLLLSIGDGLEDIQLLEPSMTQSNNPTDQHEFFYSASDLIEYGIKLKRPKKVKRPFWDIKWKSNGVLEIPRIFINNRFKVVFQNLVTFEQQCRKRNQLRPVITEYVTLMDKLIKSGTDVGHLHQAGIIVHQLRSDAEVASLFNELGKLAFVDPRVTSHYTGLYQQLNEHCNRWNHWKSELKMTYFGNPWAMASLFAAIVLLFLAFFQTFYTVYPYYWPPSRY